MDHVPVAGAERAATANVAEGHTPTGVALCSHCPKLPDCFGRLFCPRRDLR